MYKNKNESVRTSKDYWEEKKVNYNHDKPVLFNKPFQCRNPHTIYEVIGLTMPLSTISERADRI